MPPSSQPPYVKDERVLCFHHELLYEAKVLESKLSDPDDKKSPLQYRVHYKGWKNTWDDWVPQDRLRKFTEDNKELAQNLKKEMDALRQRAAPKGTAASKKKYVGSDLSSTRGSEERNSSVPVTGRGQKRGREFEMEKVGDEKFTLSSVSEARPESGTPDCFSSQGSRTPSTLPSSPPPRKVVVRRPMFFDGAGDTPPGSPAAGTTSPIANGSSSDLSTPPASPIEKAASTTTTTKPKVGPKSRATRSQSKATTDTKTTSKNAKRQLEAATKVEQSEPEPPAKRQRGRRGVAVQIGKPAESAPKSEPSCTTQGEPESAVVPSLTKAAGESSKRKRATTTEEEQEIPAKRPHGTKGTKKAAAPTHLELQGPETQPNDSKRNNGKKQSTKVSPPKQEESFVTKPAVKIPIPDNLKMILVDDWEQVTKNHAILPLPVPHPVNEILELYEEDERKNRRPGSAEYDLLVETVHGIKEYFAKCLGKILLYKLEREQYFEMRACWEGCILEWEGKGPGDIYGAEHLIRLFSNLPELIAQTNMDQQSISRLREEVIKMTLWISKHADSIFTVAYEACTHEYIEKSKGHRE